MTWWQYLKGQGSMGESSGEEFRELNTKGKHLIILKGSVGLSVHWKLGVMNSLSDIPSGGLQATAWKFYLQSGQSRRAKLLFKPAVISGIIGSPSSSKDCRSKYRQQRDPFLHFLPKISAKKKQQ